MVMSPTHQDLGEKVQMYERVTPNVVKNMASSKNGKVVRAVAAQRARESKSRAEIEESGEMQIMQNLVHHSLKLVFYSRSNI